MKTRRFFLYLIIYVGINLFASCENEIPYTPPYREPQLIMNALLDAGEHENFVFLSVSGIEGISHVETASLTLYINGTTCRNSRRTTSIEAYRSLDVVYDPDAPLNNLPEIAKRKKYRITTTLNPGDNIRLEAIAENGKYHATAEVTVPYPVNTIQVDTCLARLKEYNGWNTYRQFKITLQDRPNEKNHYRLDIRNDITVYGQYNNYKDTHCLLTVYRFDKSGRYHINRWKAQ